MTEAPRQEWPRELWMAEREEHDQGVVTAVLSEHATVARFPGDIERDREFHRYVDGDIHESLERYYKNQLEAARTADSAALTVLKQMIRCCCACNWGDEDELAVSLWLRAERLTGEPLPAADHPDNLDARKRLEPNNG